MVDSKKPVLAHLEELRKRILYSLLAIVTFSALSYMFAEEILGYLSRYVKNLVFIGPEEAFLSYLKISLFSGLFCAAPVIIYNILRFIWVALDKKERGAFLICLVLGVSLFLGGAFFSYYLVLPVALNFLLGFSSEFLKPYISVARYISFCGFLMLAFSVAFETPLFVALLSRMKVLNSGVLRRKRKYFIILLFIIAAFLTPPDVITQVLLAVPLIVLYEISIIFARLTEGKK